MEQISLASRLAPAGVAISAGGRPAFCVQDVLEALGERIGSRLGARFGPRSGYLLPLFVRQRGFPSALGSPLRELVTDVDGQVGDEEPRAHGRWRMALFWLSDEAWAAIEPHLPRNQPVPVIPAGAAASAPSATIRNVIAGRLRLIENALDRREAD
jgi:hypothetical protein